MAGIRTLFAFYVLLSIAGFDVAQWNCFGYDQYYTPGYRRLTGRWNRWSGYFPRTSSTTELPSWPCKDGKSSILHSQVCDGLVDCGDESDEVACNKTGPIMYYYSYESGVHYTSPLLSPSECMDYRTNAPKTFENVCRTIGEEILYLSSFDLNTYHVNHVNVLNNTMRGPSSSNESIVMESPPWKYENMSFTKYIRMSTGGGEMHFYYFANDTTDGVTKAFLKRGRMRNRFKDAIVQETTSDNFTSPISDWWSSNVFVLMNSEIQLCDEDVRLCSKFLKSKHAKNPLMFTIAQKQRFLFWVKKVTNLQFLLLKYNLNVKSTTKNSSVTVVKNDLSKQPVALTVDPVTDRIYWMDKDSQELSFTSTLFNGSDIKTTRRDLLGSVHVTSFAVYNNKVYWADVSDRRIWACSISENCSSIDAIPHALLPRPRNMTDRYVSNIGTLLIDYNSSLVNITPDKTCQAAGCSHLCYPYPDGTFDCYCEELSYSDSTSETKNGTLCIDKTLIVTYQNQLFTVGLQGLETPPIIRQYTLNIANISTIVYDPLQGRVILAEVGQQNIYAWTPRTKELKKILTDGPGTITSIEFDDTSNNLYWIDPKTSTLKLMNLQNGRRLNLVSGNSSYLLTDFALQIYRGSMALLFLKNNSSTVVEHFPMSGLLDRREVIYEDHEANDVGHLFIQAMNSIYEERRLYLLDTQTNEIKFLSDGGAQAAEDSNKNIQGKMRTVAFVDGTFVWTTEHDLTIRRVTTESYFYSKRRAMNFLFGQQYSSLLAISDVTQTIQLPGLARDANRAGILSVAPALKSSSLDMDSYYGSSTLKCLQNNGGCDELCVRSDTSYRGTTCLCTEGKVLVHRNTCVIASEAETTTEYSRESHSTRATSLATNIDESDEDEPAERRAEKTDSTHMNFLFPIFLGILCGFALGYFRENLLLKFQSARLHLANYVPRRVQFSRMRADESSANIL